jgi:acetyl-CoA acetyltransferase
MRDDELTFDQARTASDINLLIAPPLKVSDCSQIADGAAAVVFVLETFRRKSATARDRAAHRLCAHDGLFVAEKKGRVRFSDRSESRRASLCDGWHRPARH